MKAPRDAVPGAPLDLVVQAPVVLREDLDILALLTDTDAIEPLTRAANDAYALRGIGAHSGVTEACAGAGYDCALVPQARTLDRVRLVAMDMDSTLITIECIDEIADLQGIKPQVAAITARAMRGEIDFRASLAERVALLAGLPVSALERVYGERLRLSPGAETMVAGFKAAGAKLLLVSGGFTFFTDRLEARLGIDHTLSNALEIVDGRLTGRVTGDIVDAPAKAAALRHHAAALRGDGGLVVAIGDGANDLPMLMEADVSIAYRAKPAVRAQAAHAIDQCGLDAVLNLFG
ncbi:MAG: phosphoserine phosphatase SerB [Betaproteobacteria bacterium]